MAVSKNRVDRLLGAFASYIDEDGPVPEVSRDEAVAVTRRIHAELDDGLIQRDAAIRAQGREIACARGCSSCCANIIIAHEAEALTTARWLAEPAQAAQRARFEQALPTWRARFGDLVDRTRVAAAQENQAVLHRIFREGIERGLMCPFNHEGSCDIYPARPALCREKFALDSQEPCKRHEAGPTLSIVSITSFMERIRSLEQGMQITLRPEAQPHLMPFAERVAELLAERPPPGRNDPCPCGSGKKYKKCCAAAAT